MEWDLPPPLDPWHPLLASQWPAVILVVGATRMKLAFQLALPELTYRVRVRDSFLAAS